MSSCQDHLAEVEATAMELISEPSFEFFDEQLEQTVQSLREECLNVCGTHDTAIEYIEFEADACARAPLTRKTKKKRTNDQPRCSRKKHIRIDDTKTMDYATHVASNSRQSLSQLVLCAYQHLCANGSTNDAHRNAIESLTEIIVSFISTSTAPTIAAWSHQCKRSIDYLCDICLTMQDRLDSVSLTDLSLYQDVQLALFGGVSSSVSQDELSRTIFELRSYDVQSSNVLDSFEHVVCRCCREAVYATCGSAPMECVLSLMYGEDEISQLKELLEMERDGTFCDRNFPLSNVYHGRCHTNMTLLNGFTKTTTLRDRCDVELCALTEDDTVKFVSCFRHMVTVTSGETTRQSKLIDVLFDASGQPTELYQEFQERGVIVVLSSLLVHVFATRVSVWRPSLKFQIALSDPNMQMNDIILPKRVKKDYIQLPAAIKHTAATRRSCERDRWWRELACAFTCSDVLTQNMFVFQRPHSVRSVELMSDNYINSRWSLFSEWLKTKLLRAVFQSGTTMSHSTIRNGDFIPAYLARACVDSRRALASRVPLIYIPDPVWPTSQLVRLMDGMEDTQWSPGVASHSKRECVHTTLEWSRKCGATESQCERLKDYLDQALPTHDHAFEFLLRTLTYHY